MSVAFILVCGGLVLAAIAAFWVVVIAFSEDGIGWGLVTLFVPLGKLIYGLTHLDAVRKPVVWFVVAGFVTSIGLFEGHRRSELSRWFATMEARMDDARSEEVAEDVPPAAFEPVPFQPIERETRLTGTSPPPAASPSRAPGRPAVRTETQQVVVAVRDTVARSQPSVSAEPILRVLSGDAWKFSGRAGGWYELDDTPHGVEAWLDANDVRLEDREIVVVP